MEDALLVVRLRCCEKKESSIQLINLVNLAPPNLDLTLYNLYSFGTKLNQKLNHQYISLGKVRNLVPSTFMVHTYILRVLYQNQIFPKILTAVPNPTILV